MTKSSLSPPEALVWPILIFLMLAAYVSFTSREPLDSMRPDIANEVVVPSPPEFENFDSQYSRQWEDPLSPTYIVSTSGIPALLPKSSSMPEDKDNKGSIDKSEDAQSPQAPELASAPAAIRGGPSISTRNESAVDVPSALKSVDVPELDTAERSAVRKRTTLNGAIEDEKKPVAESDKIEPTEKNNEPSLEKKENEDIKQEQRVEGANLFDFSIPSKSKTYRPEETCTNEEVTRLFENLFELECPDEEDCETKVTADGIIQPAISRGTSGMSGRVMNIMPVLLPGGPYEEDFEARLRIRYAVVSALDRAGYFTANSRAISTFEIPLQISGEGGSLSTSKHVLKIPFNVYKQNRTGPRADSIREFGGNQTPLVVVWWINEQLLGTKPLRAIDEILQINNWGSVQARLAARAG